MNLPKYDMDLAPITDSSHPIQIDSNIIIIIRLLKYIYSFFYFVSQINSIYYYYYFRLDFMFWTTVCWILVTFNQSLLLLLIIQAFSTLFYLNFLLSYKAAAQFYNSVTNTTLWLC